MFEHAFLIRGGRRNDGDRSVSAQAAALKSERDFRKPGQRHVKDEGLPGSRKRFPTRVILAGAMPRRQDQGMVRFAHCRGYPRKRCRRKPSRNAGHDEERYARTCQRDGFLAASAEYKRIAAFEPRHAAARFGKADYRIVDVALICGMRSAAFSSEMSFGFGPREIKNALVNQGVIDDIVSRL